MTRQEKQEFLSNLEERYKLNEFVFLVGMNKVNASSALEFRAEARRVNAECIVAKNTLSRIIVKDLSVKGLEQHLSKQVLTVFTNNPVETAKLLEKYEDKGYTILGGTDKTSIFTQNDVKKLASLPSLSVLRSMLLSSILGVHTKTVRVLSESAASLVRLIAIASKNKNNQ